MKQFQLQICTPAGTFFDGEAGQLSVRGVSGSLSVLAGHAPFATVIQPPECRVYLPDGSVREGVCGDGFLTTDGTLTRLFLSTFSWKDEAPHT